MKNSVSQFLFGASQFFKTNPHAEAYQGIFPKQHLQSLFYAKKELEKKQGETEQDSQQKSEQRIEKINQTLSTFASNPSEAAQPNYPDPVVKILNDYQQLASDRASGAVSREQLVIRQGGLNQSFNSLIDKSPVAPLGGLITTAGKAVVSKVADNLLSKAATAIGASVGGPIGAAIGKLIAWIGKEVVSRIMTAIARNKEKFLEGLGGILAIGGLVVGGITGATSVVAGVGMIGAGLVSEAGGPSAALGNLASAGGAALGAIATATVGIIAVPTAIALIVTPIIVALILFIINSGAYVVPPAPSGVVPGQTCISANIPQATPGNVGSPSGVANLPICSTGCFKFEDGWPADARASEEDAINYLSKASIYMDKLCSKGDIMLRWGGYTTVRKGGDVLAGPNIISIYTLGVGSLSNSLYTLAHESGHIFARRYGDIFRQYVDTAGVGNILICTYPLANSSGESFAEMISLYDAESLIPTTRHFGCLGGKTFKEAYPNHWKFAHDYIFQENLGW